MEEDWFNEEAILDLEGSSAYLIPAHRIINLIQSEVDEN